MPSGDTECKALVRGEAFNRSLIVTATLHCFTFFCHLVQVGGLAVQTEYGY